ncbi:MAG: PolC-type DNA polymerase III, partial [Clostridia bacterium]|nr:PolC-type DNA polymerase III [Clostridia bacterium]
MNWNDVVDFFSKKYILTRASFMNSQATVENDCVNVKLGAKGKFMLLQKNIDKTVSDYIFNTSGKRYEVNFIEPENEVITNVNREDDIIKKLLEENAKRAQELALENEKNKKEKGSSKTDENPNKENKKSQNANQQVGQGSNQKIMQNATINNANLPNTNIGAPSMSDEDLNSLLQSAEQSSAPGTYDASQIPPMPPLPDEALMQNAPAGNTNYSNNNPASKNPTNNENKGAWNGNKGQFNGQPRRKKSEANILDIEKLIFKGWRDTQNPKDMKIIDLAQDTPAVIIKGQVSNFDSRETKNGSFLVSFDIYDGTSSINVKAFLKAEEFAEVKPKFKSLKAARIVGTYEYNSFSKEFGVIADVIEESEFKQVTRMDDAEEKRVELHMHTQMSQMDAVSSATDLIKRAIKWGHKAVAITDHGVVQAFPEAKKASKDSDIKILYGVEAYLVPDGLTSIFDFNDNQILKDETYCVLDIETTGISKLTEKITEFGIMKVKNGEIIDTFECFVNPEKPIPEKVVEVTHITDEMVKDAETIDVVLPKVIEFVGDSTIVAHNASFDIGFIKENARKLGLKFDNTYIDTLALAKELFPDYKKYKLGIIAENLNIKVDVAHRALADVETLVKVFNVMLNMLDEKGITKFSEVDTKLAADVSFKNLPTYHAVIFATNKVGLKNLYRLVSFAHLDYFYKKPKTLKSVYKKYSEGLIIGSACEQGELYRAILDGKSEEEIEEIADFYDYLEIQPLGNNMFMVRNETVPNIEALQEINKKIVALGEKLNKPVVGTCDVHFMDPEDEMYRRILQAGQGYDDADQQAPLYFRTTEEMLKEFGYLGREKAYEVVVTNTNKIADMCEKMSPIADYKATPHIEGCEQTIRDITMNRAHELYGDPLPEIVQARIDKELDSIIKNGFSVMYIIAQKLVKKSNEDGYLVGSRGSVGSSFVANMTGITEVNSLIPHYRCSNCKYSDFSDFGVKNGFDLPDKICPVCGQRLDKDGMDIPFETFLGFDGDKEPDIDLNFSGEYQAKAHRYTEVIFGKGTTFKAGTIGTIADKTAFGYVKKYYEERHQMVNSAEILRESVGCTGIKRTTGQHPGGIIVVPMGNEIYEFCPVQHPADDPNSNIITTHFDYHSIDQNLLKLDILGHDDPTVIRMLQDLTGIDPQTIPLDDKETMSIFCSTDALGVTKDQIHSEVGTFGVPEFGTKFVRGMLVDTKPTKFEELLRISGLSHGTDVWLNNAQTLINEGTIKLEEAICTRDDIMIYLIKQGLPPKPSFKIMESVRKGKGLTEEQEALMRENNVPDWYIASCKKIKYMSPKAHAAAYVTMAFRIAWFKVHVPRAYYTAFYTVRADGFDSEIMAHGKERVLAKMREIDAMGNTAAAKDKDMYPILEIVLEMYERGFNFTNIDLY